MSIWTERFAGLGKNLLLLVGMTVIMLLFLEAGGRLAGVSKVYGFHQFIQPSLVLHNELIPNAVSRYISEQGEFDIDIRINSLGLRDREYTEEKPKGVYRILVLGDSPVVGIEVPSEETFPNQLEQLLNQKQPGRFEVLNGGMQGYSPILYYLFLKEKGLKFDPDMILLNFSITDVTDDYNYAMQAKFDENGLPVSVTKVVQLENQMSSVPFRQFLRNNSVLYHFIRDRYHRFLYEIKTEEAKFIEEKPSDPSVESTEKSEINIALAPHLAHLQKKDLREDFFAIFNEEFLPEEEAAWQQTLVWLRAIHQLCRENQIPMALIPVPQPNQVSTEEWKEGKQLWGFDADHMITSPHFQGRLQVFSEQEQIPFINPLPQFREVSRQKHLFYPFDGHLNPEGHRLMAEHILSALSTQHILPQNTIPE